VDTGTTVCMYVCMYIYIYIYLETVEASEYRDSVYKLRFATFLESVFRIFVSVSYFVCGDEVVWTS
jgi:hypothetical protein